ncbi:MULTISPECIES: pyruvate carboxylase subunit B [Kosmotoga]|uniref:Conserved carboxylase region n=1 Tax=Kosmotoga olearia (strain ATCC BAA-1733 / DSM 21960 / TBF 19.5.1) TaxID=521045 RepID=C5CDY6_KOSOT|nr:MULTISPECIES: pyruvate carboxylase subunit B [Kosmotoga]ACR80088.1 Conserved carboxylase region [Kosmotoga olearia TBF 19.5.1]MDI3523632.1 oxaloacetate decarboxylase (Na+ extruding) subunit alpha [Kosmotoga sp.]MDK2953524.1 oxaloacetate decarboxylase (Na+ extruding) subunit alpha [Kosmotoga sp.]OAA20439.1 oxaloacetate decarboxylase [Kosmotoga sp. DU53]
MEKVTFTDTTFRDAHQSLLATRVSTNELKEIAPLVDEVGYHAVEIWGGATYDACVRYLFEDPWERLDELRKRFKKTKIQMLLRGQNLLGYKHYADDVVELFVKKMADHGMDIVRIFDALNDFRNIEKTCKEVKKNGMHLQVALAYTISPVHNVEYFVSLAEKAVNLNADSLCIKDMAGLLTPGKAYELVKAIKERFDLPLEIHAHFTTGVADMSYIKAVEAGADILDTAISPLAYGTSQPAVESLWIALHDLGNAYEPDLKLLERIANYFEEVRKRHSDTDVKLTTTKPAILVNQIPGGMYSNLINQLKGQNALHLLNDVLEEVPRVRKDLGYPPLVTPTSQIVGVQAVLNVLSGERYKLITKEVERYVRGYYGKPPAEISPELKERILKDEKAITCRPADLLEPELDKAREKIGILAKTDEDLLTYILLGEVGKKYLLKKYEKELAVDFSTADEYSDTTAVYPI